MFTVGNTDPVRNNIPLTSPWAWLMSRHSVECAVWCAKNCRPFSIIDDQAFRNLLLNGSPERKLPSRQQISRDVNALVTAAESHLREEFKVSDCRLQQPRENGLTLASRTSIHAFTSQPTVGRRRIITHLWVLGPISIGM